MVSVSSSPLFMNIVVFNFYRNKFTAQTLEIKCSTVMKHNLNRLHLTHEWIYCYRSLFMNLKKKNGNLEIEMKTLT
jgi:hypothetical protein